MGWVVRGWTWQRMVRETKRRRRALTKIQVRGQVWGVSDYGMINGIYIRHLEHCARNIMMDVADLCSFGLPAVSWE
jgi:hypothetical protein